MNVPAKAAAVELARQLFARAQSRAVLPYLAMAALLVIAILVAGDELERHITTIEAWITGLGPWGVVAFIVLFAVATSSLIPDTMLSIMAGALFGLRLGLAGVIAGALAGSTLQYALAQRLLRARIERLLQARPSLLAIQKAVRQDEVKLQTLLRLTPLSPATMSYVLGATGVRYTGFLLACLALIPNLAVEVYFGYASKHVAHMAGRATGGVSVHDLTVLGGVAATLGVMVIVSQVARKAVAQAVAESEVQEPVVTTA